MKRAREMRTRSKKSRCGEMRAAYVYHPRFKDPGNLPEAVSSQPSSASFLRSNARSMTPRDMKTPAFQRSGLFKAAGAQNYHHQHQRWSCGGRTSYNAHRVRVRMCLKSRSVADLFVARGGCELRDYYVHRYTRRQRVATRQTDGDHSHS
ncbi:hypothetical protein FKP32DRAFT_175379 [Trametes sanguinea]|nr:hypothetical protein FKP32DRAFT_175379 [Trametes sanguinea]